jgi:hypothetical protein
VLVGIGDLPRVLGGNEPPAPGRSEPQPESRFEPAAVEDDADPETGDLARSPD